MDPDHSSTPLEETVSKLAALHAKSEEAVSHHQRRIERLTGQLGRPATIYWILAAVALWVGWNLVAPAHSLFDPPPFTRLQLGLSFASLLVSAMVLTTQNRQGLQARQRSHLDLHINLLAEQKTAKLIAMLEELRRDLPSVPNRSDPEADAMASAADPETLIDAIEKRIE